MFHYTTDIDMPSNDLFQINRNVGHVNSTNQNHNSEDNTEIEIVNINCSFNEQSDSDEHDSALNAAWSFIDEARQNLNSNKGYQRNVNNPSRRQVIQKYNIKNNIHNSSNEILLHSSENWKEENHCCHNTTINDYLDALENSYDDEAPNKMQQNYFNNETNYNKNSVYDSPSSIYAEEGPVLIYSYTNNIFETNNYSFDSPNNDSSTTSGSSTSFGFSEETKKCERKLYRMAASFHPIIIPRLPLEFTLPTVTEIHEPNIHTPPGTDVSSEENITVKRKQINSWIKTDEESTNSEENAKYMTGENSKAESTQSSVKARLYDTSTTALIHRQNESNGPKDVAFKSKHSNISLKDPKTNNKLHLCKKSLPTIRWNGNMTLGKKNGRKTNDLDAVIVDPESKVLFSNDNFESKEQNSSSTKREVLSIRSSIPTLHLSLSPEADSTKQSWFKRLFKCILCCF